MCVNNMQSQKNVFIINEVQINKHLLILLAIILRTY